MIIFSKTAPTDYGVYKVYDPWTTVNKFLALNLERYGFVKLEDEVKQLLLSDNVVKTSDFNIPFSIVGNRIENFDFHINRLEKIVSNPTNKTIWIESTLLRDFLPYLKRIEGAEIEIIDRYNHLTNMISGNDISVLLGLFGKFYSKKISRSESKIIGSVQESLNGCALTDNMSYQESLSILDILSRSSDENAPPINIVNKLKESILFTI
jgi:hypothetical protein